MSERKVPKIRFPGFTEEWEELPMSEVFEERMEKNHPEMPVLSVMQGQGTVLRDNSDRNIQYDKSNLKGYKLIREGDYIIHLRSFEGGLEYSNHDGISSPAYRILKPVKIVPSAYRGYFRSKDFIKNKLSVAVVGIRDGKNIDMPSFWDITIPVPEIKEQENISQFLLEIDDQISTQQKELDKWKELKKGMLQKMFPKEGESVPEIRFPGFTDPWELRKSGDIAPLRGGFAFKSSEYCSDGVPIIRISNILLDGSVGAEFAYYNEQDSDEKYALYDGAAILAMSGATTGKVSVLHDEKGRKYYQNQRVGYFIPTDNCDYSFIRTIVRSQLFLDQLSAVLVAGAQPNVSSKEIDEFEYMIPKSDNEQRVIGECFENLDNLITLHQRECDSWLQLKKALLQQMFVA